MKKKTHAAPMEYRIKYTINGALEESIQYYNVYHSSEALDFLAHTYRRGHIHGGDLSIVSVEEYNRFSSKWEDRTTTAADHSNSPEIITGSSGKVFLKHASQV